MSDGRDDGGVAPGRRRRSWSLYEKRRIVEESLADGASLAEVARRHDLNANQLFTWRRQFGMLERFGSARLLRWTGNNRRSSLLSSCAGDPVANSGASAASRSPGRGPNAQSLREFFLKIDFSRIANKLQNLGPAEITVAAPCAPRNGHRGRLCARLPR